MRIALISTCALATPPKAYGGTELVVAELAKGLIALGHEVTVFATGDSTTEGTLRSTFMRPAWPPNDLTEQRHAGFAWAEIAAAEPRFDVVHAHTAAALPYSRLVPRPTLLTIHHMREERLLAHYQAYPDVAYVAISQRQAALCPELHVTRVIHHGVDPVRYPAGDGRGGYVAFLGRFAPEKAPHVAIDAAVRAGVPLRLGGAPHEVALDYYERELEPRLGARGVEHCGELDHEGKMRLLRQARALLVPLHWEEPFGLVMIEAMLVGTPVIAFARGSAPEVVEDGVTGFLVENERELAARIGQLDRIDRRRCRARARARWCHLRMADEYAALYEQVALRSSVGARVPFVAGVHGRARAVRQVPAQAGGWSKSSAIVRIVDGLPAARDDRYVESRDECRDPSSLETARDGAEREAPDTGRVRCRV